jgi:histidinol-phosphate aminotransferase
VISPVELEQLARCLPQTLVLLDLAYVEFADQDLCGLALEYPNVLVLRTFSKAWGCAGLRVGYVVGDPRVVQWLRSVGQPYPVGAPSLHVVKALLGSHPKPRRAFVERVRQQRAALAKSLLSLGVESLPSQANFVLAQFEDADGVRQALASLGIAVRGFSGNPSLRQWLRITLPGEESSYQRLEGALRTVLEVVP